MSVFSFRIDKDFAEKDILTKFYKARVKGTLIVGQIIRIKARREINNHAHFFGSISAAIFDGTVIM